MQQSAASHSSAYRQCAISSFLLNFSPIKRVFDTFTFFVPSKHMRVAQKPHFPSPFTSSSRDPLFYANSLLLFVFHTCTNPNLPIFFRADCFVSTWGVCGVTARCASSILVLETSRRVVTPLCNFTRRRYLHWIRTHAQCVSLALLKFNCRRSFSSGTSLYRFLIASPRWSIHPSLSVPPCSLHFSPCTMARLHVALIVQRESRPCARFVTRH